MPSLGDKTKPNDPSSTPGDTVPAGGKPMPSNPGASASETLTRLGRYAAHRELGRGGMGVVYVGHDPGLDRPVALKTLSRTLAEDEGFRARFSTEARALARIEHPNVVQVYDVGEDGGTPFFAMELVQGQSAEQLVRETGPLPLAQAVDIVRQAAAGLQAAHAQGILHRDVKPSNLILDAKGRVKVLDFGLAKAQGMGPATATDIVMGTPEYMSPEQGRGDTIDLRSDIYALGATLHFLIAGAPPFTATTALGTIHKQVNEPPPPIGQVRAGVPLELEALILRLLSKEPAKRPQDHAALIEALGAIDLGAWPPPFLKFLRTSLFRPSAAVRKALGSSLVDQPKQLLGTAAGLLALSSIMMLLQGAPTQAIIRPIRTAVFTPLVPAATLVVGKLFGRQMTFNRALVAETAAMGYCVPYWLAAFHNPFWSLVACVAIFNARRHVMRELGVTMFGIRWAMLLITSIPVALAFGP